ncbi:MAG: endonuclease domain-containing protein [Stenotrophomonas sp.]
MREGRKTRFAQSLRRRATEAERCLWRRLRDRRLLGCKFRRQWPLGPYVVDFICLECRLVIELDGSQHLDCTRDVRRDAFLRDSGFEVLRFWNNDALANTGDVCDVIARGLTGRRSFFPPSAMPKDPVQGG